MENNANKNEILGVDEITQTTLITDFESGMVDYPMGLEQDVANIEQTSIADESFIEFEDSNFCEFREPEQFGVSENLQLQQEDTSIQDTMPSGINTFSSSIMDSSKTHQQELQYSCGAGVASVNLFTGRLLFECQGLSIGAGNLTIGFDHVYNSHLPGASQNVDTTFANGLNTRVGRQWKLNVQQYIWQEGSNWLYADSAGMIHNFAVLNPNLGNILHDIGGLGLILNTNLRTIRDEDDNIMQFNNEGRLISVMSAGIDSRILKHYALLGNDLDNLRDNRQASRRINFRYTHNRLSQADMAGVENNQRLRYFYNAQGRLVRISQTSTNGNEPIRDRAFFMYNSLGRLERIIDGVDFSYLRFVYIGDRVTRVETGVMSRAGLGTVFADNASIPITGHIITGQTVIAGGRPLRLQPNIVDTIDFSYSTTARHTMVTTNGVSMRYQYHHDTGDRVGEVFAILEQDGNNLVSVFPNPDAGIRLYNGNLSPGSAHFDSIPIAGVGSQNATLWSIAHNSSNRTPLDEIDQNRALTVTGIDRPRKFTLSAWVRLATGLNVGSAALAVDFTQHDRNPHTVRADVNVNIRNSNWQYIERDFWLEAGNNRELRNITVRFESNATNLMSGNSHRIGVANVRVTPHHSTPHIRNRNTPNITSDIAHFAGITLVREGISNQTIDLSQTLHLNGSADFVTPQDIIRTQRSMFLNWSGNDTTGTQNPFIFSCNNGRKRIGGVTAVTFNRGSGGSIPLGFNLATDNNPGFFVESHARSDVRVETFFRFGWTDGDRRTQLVHRAHRASPSLITWQRASYSTFGSIPRWESDEYGVRTDYNSDNFGNILEVRISGGNLTMSSRIGYNGDTLTANGGVTRGSEALREHIIGETNALGHWIRYDIRPNSTTGNITCAANRMRKELTISPVCGRIEGERMLRGANLQTENNRVEYGYRDVVGNNGGLLHSLSSVTGTHATRLGRYELAYDIRNRLSRVNVAGNDSDMGTIFAMRTTNSPQTNGNHSISTTHTGHPAQDSSWNRYKQPTVSGQIAGADTAHSVVMYRDFHDRNNDNAWESTSAGKPWLMADGFGSDEWHTMTYDAAGKGLTRYNRELVGGTAFMQIGTDQNPSSVSVGMANFPRESVDSTWRRYVVRTGNERNLYTTECFDPNTFLSPRMTWLLTIHGNNVGHSSSHLAASTQYVYDDLGRIRIKETSRLRYTYTYRASAIASTTTPVVATMRVDTMRDGVATHVRTEVYGYDNNGNVTTVSTGNVVNTYDDLGRLTTQTGGSAPSSTVFQADGNISSRRRMAANIHGGTTSHNLIYSYDNRRRLNNIFIPATTSTAMQNLHITYDSVGNPTRYRTTVTTSPVNMLWERGRLLREYNPNGGLGATGSVSFRYDASGERVSKTSNGVTRHYYLEGGKILAERTGTNNDIELNYDYDESGVCALWHGALYHVVERNHMGDVTALYRYNHDMISSLTKVAEYEYSATGEITRVRGWVRVSSGGIFGSPSYEWREGAAIPADHIAHANPWRWRGYYFDRETNLYYMGGGQYYDPFTARRVNSADFDEMLANPHENPYVAFGNNWIMAPSNGHSYHNYFSIVPEIGNMRRNWLTRWFGQAHEVWDGLPTWAQVTIGTVVLVGLVAATIATGGVAGIVAAKAKASVAIGVKAGAAAFAKSGAKALGVGFIGKGKGASGVLGAGAAGAITAGTSGAIFGGIQGGWDGAASGFGLGAISGALGGFAGKGIAMTQPFTGKGANFAFRIGANALASSGINMGIQLAFTGKVNWGKVGISFGVGAIPFGPLKAISPFIKDGLALWWL